MQRVQPDLHVEVEKNNHFTARGLEEGLFHVVVE